MVSAPPMSTQHWQSTTNTFLIDPAVTPMAVHKTLLLIAVHQQHMLVLIKQSTLQYCLLKCQSAQSPYRPETWREVCPSEDEEDRQEAMDQLSSYLVQMQLHCCQACMVACSPPQHALFAHHLLVQTQSCLHAAFAYAILRHPSLQQRIHVLQCAALTTLMADLGSSSCCMCRTWWRLTCSEILQLALRTSSVQQM